ncbi:MAG: GlxA family transcriptional regulator [Tateyamaria sp.]|jgi:transcriptional regulator GlxA family with amidase domain|nr:GlxA family transcriptional regulator [Tateyamaria sp.]MBT5302077.1 GlxA family transcriptional regulator [Tateyamaria sp.]MBT6266592.1 GlxA family transcriptional regulator [Tateyamaria sp.]MBT6342269.1 GlxA family transcriptional regulator [Tateyamaria sp.]MBT7446707.1 GlxA family transcriptional regulator [Tateyamaria sp.]
MYAHEKKDIGFLIFPGFPMACLTSMIEPLRAANEIVGYEVFRWSLVSEDGGRTEASARVSFEPDKSLCEIDKVDQIYLLSDPSSNFKSSKRSHGHLRKLAKHGAILGAVSGGVFPLARSGLLTGYIASVHWCYEGAFGEEFPELKTSKDVITIDSCRITASGAAAAFDLSLHMIEEAFGADVATEVACWFQHPLVRGQGVSQQKPTFANESTNDMLPSSVRDAVTMFSNHLDDPLNISDVAREVGVSVRQLERLFQKTTGRTPLIYYRSLRMHKARQLLLYSTYSISQIAAAVGYSSSFTLNKNYLEVFGILPREERKKVNMFRVSQEY